MSYDIDDSALLHGRYYDPAKARAYYLRTRQLKGRRAGGAVTPVGRARSGQGTSAHIRPSRRAELKAQKAALEKRLDRLREVLAERVKAAKRRSGIEVKPEPKTTTKEPAAKQRDKNSKPLTEKQKRDKREAAKKQYEKEQGTNLSQEVQQLQAQVRDIRAQIETAIKDARRKSAHSQSVTASKGR